MSDFGKYIYCELRDEERGRISCGLSEEKRETGWRKFDEMVMGADEIQIDGGIAKARVSRFGKKYLTITPEEEDDQLTLSKKDNKIKVSEVSPVRESFGGIIS